MSLQQAGAAASSGSCERWCNQLTGHVLGQQVEAAHRLQAANSADCNATGKHHVVHHGVSEAQTLNHSVNKWHSACSQVARPSPCCAGGCTCPVWLACAGPTPPDPALTHQRYSRDLSSRLASAALLHTGGRASQVAAPTVHWSALLSSWTVIEDVRTQNTVPDCRTGDCLQVVVVRMCCACCSLYAGAPPPPPAHLMLLPWTSALMKRTSMPSSSNSVATCTAHTLLCCCNSPVSASQPAYNTMCASTYAVMSA